MFCQFLQEVKRHFEIVFMDVINYDGVTINPKNVASVVEW
jgi:hypothetical protein